MWSEAARGHRLGAEQPAREREEVLVHVPLAREGDRGRLEIRPFHEPYRGAEREQAFDVVRRATEIRLQRDAHARRSLAQLTEQIDGAIDVGRTLHVEPDEVARGFGVGHQLLQLLTGEIGVDVEPEVRRFDGDLRVQTRWRAPRPSPSRSARPRRGRPRRMGTFSPRCVKIVPIPELFLCPRGRQRVVEPLSRHERRHGAAHEGGFRGMVTKPRIGGRRQQQLASERHVGEDTREPFRAGRVTECDDPGLQARSSDAPEIPRADVRGRAGARRRDRRRRRAGTTCWARSSRQRSRCRTATVSS